MANEINKSKVLNETVYEYLQSEDENAILNQCKMSPDREDEDKLVIDLPTPSMNSEPVPDSVENFATDNIASSFSSGKEVKDNVQKNCLNLSNINISNKIKLNKCQSVSHMPSMNSAFSDKKVILLDDNKVDLSISKINHKTMPAPSKNSPNLFNGSVPSVDSSSSTSLNVNPSNKSSYYSNLPAFPKDVLAHQFQVSLTNNSAKENFKNQNTSPLKSINDSSDNNTFISAKPNHIDSSTIINQPDNLSRNIYNSVNKFNLSNSIKTLGHRNKKTLQASAILQNSQGLNLQENQSNTFMNPETGSSMSCPGNLVSIAGTNSQPNSPTKRVHDSTKGSNFQKFVCPVCNECFISKRSFNSHIIVHCQVRLILINELKFIQFLKS